MESYPNFKKYFKLSDSKVSNFKRFWIGSDSSEIKINISKSFSMKT